MNWDNLRESKCPKCEKVLKFRTSTRNTKIRSRKGKEINEDMYFCFKCNFQITTKKIKSFQGGDIHSDNKQANDIFNQILRKVVF